MSYRRVDSFQLALTINLQSGMGCGASTDNKTVVQTVPLVTAQDTSLITPPINKSQPPKTTEKTSKPYDKNQNSQIQRDRLGSKTSRSKEPGRAKPESKATLQNSTTDIRSSSTQKPNPSPSKNNNQLKSSSKDIRNSSLSKSQSPSKNKGSSLEPTNPEDLQKLRMTESVIEEEPLKGTQTREKDKTVKKIKSVKNNKELADLIKIYGL